MHSDERVALANEKDLSSRNFSRVLVGTMTVFVNHLLLYLDPGPGSVLIREDRKEFCSQTLHDMGNHIQKLRGYLDADIGAMGTVTKARLYVPELSQTLRNYPETDPIWASMLPKMYHGLWGQAIPDGGMTTKALGAWNIIEKGVRQLYQLPDDKLVLDFFGLEAKLEILRAWERVDEAFQNNEHLNVIADTAYDSMNSKSMGIHCRLRLKGLKETLSKLQVLFLPFKSEARYVIKPELSFQRSSLPTYGLSVPDRAKKASYVLNSTTLGGGLRTSRRLKLILEGDKTDPRSAFEESVRWIVNKEGHQLEHRLMRDFRDLAEKQRQRVTELEKELRESRPNNEMEKEGKPPKPAP
ncbi:hypothetical protein MMC10_002056 [Thelotrema lepadinum]|nr:hypothetical protein [Thelotrema lepadinum]